MDITPQLNNPWQYKIPPALLTRDPYADILKSLLQGGQDIQQGQEQQKANQLNEILGYLSKGYQPGPANMPNPQLQGMQVIPKNVNVPQIGPMQSPLPTMGNMQLPIQGQAIQPTTQPNPQIPQSIGPVNQAPLQSTIPTPGAIGGIYNQGTTFVPKQAKPQTDKLGQAEALFKFKETNKAPGTAQQQELTDKEASDIASQIKSGDLPPSVVNKYYSIRTGIGVRNSEKINNALLGDPTKAFDLGDYEQSFAQEQKNRPMYSNISNTRKDGILLKEAATMYQNSSFKDWNSFVMNLKSRVSDPKTAALVAAVVGYTDSVSLSLGPANVASTDNRLKLAQQQVDKKQAAKAMTAVVNENNSFLNNRESSLDEQGLKGFRKRYGLAPTPSRTQETTNAEPFVKPGGALDALLKGG